DRGAFHGVIISPRVRNGRSCSNETLLLKTRLWVNDDYSDLLLRTVEYATALFKKRRPKARLAALHRAMLSACLTVPRSEIRDLPGILCSSGRRTGSQ